MAEIHKRHLHPTDVEIQAPVRGRPLKFIWQCTCVCLLGEGSKRAEGMGDGSVAVYAGELK
jgi:hypothetical protein